MDYFKTPCYIIDRNKLNDNIHEIEDNFCSKWGKNLVLGYSVKTNNCEQILQIFRENSWYAEVVSNAEYRMAKENGYNERHIIANGPVKGEMLSLLGKKEESIINLDNMQEVNELSNYKNHRNKVGIRVNFDFEEECPDQREASVKFSRFGINYENGDLENAINTLKQKGISIVGLHMHTSTKKRSLEVFRTLSKKAVEIAEKFKLELEYIDIGGGFFGGRLMEGKPTMVEYAEVITQELKKYFIQEKTTLILEPGASVVATAVNYLTKVENVRNVENIRIVTLDGTLLHINPFMVKRKAVMELYPTGKSIVDKQILCGATCMEVDVLAEVENELELQVGDEVLFKNVGAYTISFNSNFILDRPEIYIR